MNDNLIFSSINRVQTASDYSPYEKNTIDLPIARVTKVNEENGFFSAEVVYSSQGMYSYPPVVPFSYSGFNGANKSGSFYVPQVDDIVLLAALGNGDFFPLVYLPIPIENASSQTEGEGGKKKNSRYFKDDTFQDIDKPPNFSGGMRKMKSGSQGILGSGGLCGLMVTQRRLAKIFSSEECFTEYGGDNLNAGQPPQKTDQTINWYHENDAMIIDSKRLDERSKEETKSKKCSTEYKNFCSTKRLEDDYFHRKFGHHKENKELIFSFAIREPDETRSGKKNARTKDVNPSESACCGGSDFNNGNSDVTPDSTKVKTKGVVHNAKWYLLIKKLGDYVMASKEKIEFQTKKVFNVFAELKISFLSSKDFLIHAKEKVDIIGLEESKIRSEEVEIEIKDKVRIQKTGQASSNVPTKEEGML